MKISELISTLSTILESKGDLPVMTLGMDEAGLKEMNGADVERVVNVEPNIVFDMLLVSEVGDREMIGDPFDAVVID